MEVKRKFDEDSDDESDYEWSKRPRDYTFALKPTITSEENKNKMYNFWNEKTPDAPTAVEVMLHPFKCCIVKEFIDDGDTLVELKEELVCIDLQEKNNDLYQFRQSQDLANVDVSIINKFKTFLIEDCRIWLQEVTGIELNSKLAVTYSCYTDTDYLLCHDDKCEDRRIAFILYLNDEWEDTDGGALELYDTDEIGQPKNIARSVIPENNKFVFFEVTDKSFHQVGEILTRDKTRMAVNGWFHSSVHRTKSLVPEPLPPKIFPHFSVESRMLLHYINPIYLQNEYQSAVSQAFEEESQLSLVDFLKFDILRLLSESLKNANIQWQKKGPANRRYYFVPVESTLPPAVTEFIHFFTSNTVFTFLHKLTNLDLAKPVGSTSASSSGNRGMNNPSCNYEIIKWEKGCYTLLNDDDEAFRENALDAILYFNVNHIEEEFGGFTSYIARNEELELLTVTPTENALALSYRDDQTMRFVKYINHHYDGKFFTINFVYRE